MESLQTGGCRCGAVRYEFSSSRWCGHDYSQASTRALGAPATTWTGVRFDRFIVTTGEAELRTWEGDDRVRQFCGVCGTTLVVRSPLWPEDVHVSTLTIDTPYRRPSANLFIDQKLDWAPVDERLPGFGGANGREAVGGRSIRDQLAEVHPQVRLAARWDVPALVPLIQELAVAEWGGPAENPGPALKEYLDSGAPGFFFVAEHEHAVVGFADVKYLPTTTTGGFQVFLDDLWVTESARGHGLGSALIDATKRVGSLLGADYVFALVRPDNTAAVALYERHGLDLQPHRLAEWEPDATGR